MSHSFLNGSVEEDDVDFFMSLRQRVFKPVVESQVLCGKVSFSPIARQNLLGIPDSLDVLLDFVAVQQSPSKEASD